MPPPYPVPYITSPDIVDSADIADSADIVDSADIADDIVDSVPADSIHNIVNSVSSHTSCANDSPNIADSLPAHSGGATDSAGFYAEFENKVAPSAVQDEYDLSTISLDDLNDHYADVPSHLLEDGAEFSGTLNDISSQDDEFYLSDKSFESDALAPSKTSASKSSAPKASKSLPSETLQPDISSDKNEGMDDPEFEIIDWEAFTAYCVAHDFPDEYMPYVRLSSAKIHGDECVLRISSDTALNQLDVVRKQVETFLADFIGRAIKMRYTADVYERRTSAEMMEAMHENSQIQMLQKEFGASLLRCSDLKHGQKDKRRES